MLGDDQWVVTINGGVFKGPLSRKEAEEIAARYQKGVCKHRDHRIYVDIKRDVQMIKESDERYKVAKRGERQVTNIYHEVGE